jgi:hypothetical protein
MRRSRLPVSSRASASTWRWASTSPVMTVPERSWPSWKCVSTSVAGELQLVRLWDRRRPVFGHDAAVHCTSRRWRAVIVT